MKNLQSLYVYHRINLLQALWTSNLSAIIQTSREEVKLLSYVNSFYCI